MPEQKRIWTVPNVLTMFRMALIPVYWVLMIGYRLNYWALGVFVLAVSWPENTTRSLILESSWIPWPIS